MIKLMKRFRKSSQDRKQWIHILVTTFAVIILLFVFITHMISVVDNTVTERCFDTLTTASNSFTKDLQDASREDMAVLSAIANAIAGEENIDDKQLIRLLNCYDISASYLSYVELLRPDNTMLDLDGTVRDVSGKIDFKKEAKKGKTISDICISTKDPQSKVIRNTVPVVKDGKTIYIIFGTIRLEELVEKFDTDIYGGEAYLFILDGTSGDMIMDTWHKTLGNLSDFTNRKLLPGYSWEEAQYEMQKGISGQLAFVSDTIKETVYLYYSPAGINNWNVMVMTPKRVALKDSQTIRNQLYLMAFVIGMVMIAYMIYITRLLLQSYKNVKRIGMEDKNTGLMNRIAYDKYMEDNQNKTFANVACIFVDVNGLHDINNQFGHAAGDNMLRIVAKNLMKTFDKSNVYRIGGDEFVVFSENQKLPEVEEKMDYVNQQLLDQDYSIAFGIQCYENEIGLERITRRADEKMLEHKSEYYTKHNRRKRH